MTVRGLAVQTRFRFACLVTFVGTSLLPAAAGAVSPPAHSAHFLSYRITSIATYETQPDQNLPTAAATTIGRHTVIERMVVRDSTHYRVDVQVVAPGLDSGTLTVSVAGKKMVAYDSRTGEATWNTVTGPPLQPTDIQIGLNIVPLAPTPEPGQSFSQFFAMLRQPGSVMHPRVRIVGHTRLLGHPVAIIDYGPLVGTGQTVCPRPTTRNRHPLCHAVSGTGYGRLWVATDRPALLRYTEGRFAGLPGGMMRRQYRYQVTSLRFGPVSLAATHYTPPVPVGKSTWTQLAVVGGGDSGWFGGWPQPWRTGILYRAPPPSDSHGHLYTEDGVLIRRDTLVPNPTFMGVLYYRPAAAIRPGMPPAQYHGSGPYVYLQERIQIHGLPAVLRRGQHVQRGPCSLWIGAYRKGLPWMALVRQHLALLVTTNSLTQKDLIHYGLRSLCD